MLGFFSYFSIGNGNLKIPEKPPDFSFTIAEFYVI